MISVGSRMSGISTASDHSVLYWPIRCWGRTWWCLWLYIISILFQWDQECLAFLLRLITQFSIGQSDVEAGHDDVLNCILFQYYFSGIKNVSHFYCVWSLSSLLTNQMWRQDMTMSLKPRKVLERNWRSKKAVIKSLYQDLIRFVGTFNYFLNTE